MNKPRTSSKLKEDVPPLLGFSITKYFPGHGLYYGKVVSFDAVGRWYGICYTDGDREDLYPAQVLKHAVEDLTLELVTELLMHPAHIATQPLHVQPLSPSGSSSEVSDMPRGTFSLPMAVVTGVQNQQPQARLQQHSQHSQQAF